MCTRYHTRAQHTHDTHTRCTHDTHTTHTTHTRHTPRTHTHMKTRSYGVHEVRHTHTTHARHSHDAHTTHTRQTHDTHTTHTWHTHMTHTHMKTHSYHPCFSLPSLVLTLHPFLSLDLLHRLNLRRRQTIWAASRMVRLPNNPKESNTNLNSKICR